MTDLIIPDIILVDTLNNALAAIRLNYRTAVIAGNYQKSLLWIMFNGLSLGKYIVFDNLQQLLITNTAENPRYLDGVKLSFDHDSKRPISVHISLPSESDKDNSLQIGQGDQDEMLDGNGNWSPVFSREFTSTYQVVIISDNKNEVIVLYTLFKMLLISCINNLEMSGLQNIKLGGGDVRLNEADPERRFIRPITVNFEYKFIAPEITTLNAIIDDLTFIATLMDDDTSTVGTSYPVSIDSDSSV